MSGLAQPIGGWSREEVPQTPSGAAIADTYGKLFYYLRKILREFIERLASLDIPFRIFQLDVADLPSHLGTETFSRIENSNIADQGHVGIDRSLSLMVPLLQSSLLSKHVTLITSFMAIFDDNGDEELSAVQKSLEENLDSATFSRILDDLMRLGDTTHLSYAGIVIQTRDFGDQVFDKYCKKSKMSERAKSLGGAMKERHTIVKEWPQRLKLLPGQPGYKEDVDRVHTYGETGKLRFVEWKRTE